MKADLYIQFRVHFDPRTNQDLLHEMARAAENTIFRMFDGKWADAGQLPSPRDVTSEVVMKVDQR